MHARLQVDKEPRNALGARPQTERRPLISNKQETLNHEVVKRVGRGGKNNL